LSKLCFIDVETTGLKAYTACVWQISVIVQDGPEMLGKFKANIKPYKKKQWKNGKEFFADPVIEDKALAVNGVTREELETFEEAEQVFKRLLEFLGQFIDPYKKKTDPEKEYLTFVAYNSPFDEDFVRNFFTSMKNNFYGTYFKYDICVMRLFSHFVYLTGGDMRASRKLINAYEYLGLPDVGQWHDAEADNIATFNLFNEINSRMLGLKL
jgi:DNA polymerase III epsilon subunit-like protein